MKVKVIRIAAPLDKDAFVHFNNKKPWWKKKRLVWVIKAGTFAIKDCTDTAMLINLDRLYIRFGDSKEFYPLKDHCEWR